MKLSELALPLKKIQDVQIEDLDIKAVHYHSGRVESNSLFVCVKGYQVDGHDYLQMAKENGAVVAVVETLQDVNIPQILVEDSRLALAQLGAQFYDQPSSKFKLIGITATNGKTTTSFLMDSILEAHQLKTGLVGTVVVKVDDETEASVLTTPESLDLQYYFNRMVQKNVSHCTMEVSSSALELNRAACSDFDVVALNNISREHIDNHGSFESYYNFKAGLIRDVKSTATAVLNLDDPYSKQLIEQTQAKVMTYGVKDTSGDVSISDLDLSTGQAKFKVHINHPEYDVSTFDIALAIPGYHCVYNSLAAITIALSLNIPVEVIQKGIFNFKGIERRFECIFDYDYKIYDDHFANAGNIDVTLETLDLMTYKNLQLVYAIRGNRGVTVNKENAETIVKWAKKIGLDHVIATRSIDHVTWKDEVTDDELNVFLDIMKANHITVELFDQLPDAIDLALDQVNEDDVLLLAGCQGMDYGCNIALNILEHKRPDIDKVQLRKPLQTRVAGLLEGETHE